MRRSLNRAVCIVAIFILFTGIYGQNRFEGSGQDLLNDPEMGRLYLGG